MKRQSVGVCGGSPPFPQDPQPLDGPSSVVDNALHRVGAAALLDNTDYGRVSSPPRTQLIECIECTRSWEIPTERWRLYLTDDDPPEPVAYCLECSAREFE